MNHIEQTLVEHFRDIADYREDHNKKHLLIDILVMTVCSVLCGAADGQAVVLRRAALQNLEYLIILTQGEEYATLHGLHHR